MKEPQSSRVIRNLQKAKGLTEKVLAMAKEDRYCMDIMQQCNAITGIIQQTKNLILESHLETCGASLASHNPIIKQKFIKEMLRACNVSQRR